MPELPEVETTRRGIAPHILNQRISQVIVRDHRLRWPIPADLAAQLEQQQVTEIQRRGKYLLLTLPTGTLILHLGMSGNLRVLPAGSAVLKHDHLDIVFANRHCLRLHDPRRFGAVLFTVDPVEQHPLIKDLGVEPLERALTGDYLFARSRGRKMPIKSFIMDGKIVVGVGNIYASESLFLAGIHPKRHAGRITQERYATLVTVIKKVLRAAIQQGGTTLRDFINSDGKPGYFSQHLRVYGRDGEPCHHCQQTIRHCIIGQRTTYYCPHCQT